MPTLNNQASRREEADDRKAVSQKAALQNGKNGDPRKAPFRGAPNPEHPQDPFRNIFGNSRLKFDF